MQYMYVCSLNSSWGSFSKKQVSKWPRYNAGLILHGRTFPWVWVLCAGPHFPLASVSGPLPCHAEQSPIYCHLDSHSVTVDKISPYRVSMQQPKAPDWVIIYQLVCHKRESVFTQGLWKIGHSLRLMSTELEKVQYIALSKVF